MRKFVFIILIAFFGCKMPQNPVSKQLQDTLTIVKNKLNFKPLDSAEAYDFINKYYLPGLDTIPSKRRLLIHPLIGKDFNEILKQVSADLEAKYTSSSKISKSKRLIIPPEPIGAIDENHTWNKSRLQGVSIIIDTTLNLTYRINSYQIQAWRKKFPHGYTIISYPLYNSFNKRLYIKQCIVSNVGGIDGNVDQKELWFQKINNGWKAR